MSYPKFKVGELVITQHATFFTELNGSIGVVVVPLERRLCKDLNSMKKVYAHVYGVKVLTKENLYLWFRPWQLKKLGYDDQTQFKSVDRQSNQNVKSKIVMAES